MDGWRLDGRFEGSCLMTQMLHQEYPTELLSSLWEMLRQELTKSGYKSFSALFIS